MPYLFLADAVLVFHFGVVLFVVGGLIVFVAGNWLHWRWVNRLWFRLAHLAAIAVVVAQAWLGQSCPLMIFDSWLRVQAGAAVYERSFIEDWLQRLLYYDIPFWVFPLAYTAFAELVHLTWWRYPLCCGSSFCCVSCLFVF